MTDKVQQLMDALIGEISICDLIEFLVDNDISKYDYQEIQDWFKFRGVKLKDLE